MNCPCLEIPWVKEKGRKNMFIHFSSVTKPKKNANIQSLWIFSSFWSSALDIIFDKWQQYSFHSLHIQLFCPGLLHDAANFGGLIMSESDTESKSSETGDIWPWFSFFYPAVNTIVETFFVSSGFRLRLTGRSWRFRRGLDQFKLDYMAHL